MPLEKLVCIACGAPIDKPLDQGSVTCPYCLTRNHFQADPRLVELLNRMDGKLDQLQKAPKRAAAKAVPAPKVAVPVAPPPSGNAEFVEYIRQMVKAGKKIEAIKIVRERFNSGLAEAKNYVESL